MIGFLNISKPTGITSHDLVNQVRKVARIKQVGHAGTLDPLAEGVMVVAISRACKLIQFLDDNKTYKAEILLGVRTDTDDIEGKVLEKVEFSSLDENLVREKIAQFKGKQIQIPPIYSAIKKGGIKLYELARSGQAPKELPGRDIEIFSIDILSIKQPLIEVRISCSKGTYIRSIARDLGNQLGVGGCLNSLIREASGKFKLSKSTKLKDLNEATIEKLMVSPIDALDFKSFPVNEQLARRIMHGQIIESDAIDESFDLGKEKNFFAVYNEKPVALMKTVDSSKVGPEVVLANANHF